MAQIRMKSISHSYAKKPTPTDEHALRDIDLTWADGGAYALLGPSGCGKSTLLNILSGLVIPSSGQIHYDDRDVTRLSTRERNIAQVFQFPVIYDTMTVFDNLAFPLRNRGLDEKTVRLRVHEIAELLEIQRDLPNRARALRADEKQIISLGRGLVRKDVAAILFDEPLTVIDPQLKWLLRRKLKQIHEQLKHTLIYVTHDQTEALTFASSVVVMKDARILQQGSPADLFLRPAHAFVGYFIGSPGMNFLPCKIADARIQLGEHSLPLPPKLQKAAQTQTAALKLGIRPAFIKPLPTNAKNNTGLPIQIRHVEHCGHYQILTGGLNDISLKIKLPVETTVTVGETRRFEFSPEHVLLYANDRMISHA